MVEPPCTFLPNRVYTMARVVPFQSTPWCFSNRLSSMAMAASCKYLGMSSRSVQMRFSEFRYSVWYMTHSPVSGSWLYSSVDTFVSNSSR